MIRITRREDEDGTPEPIGKFLRRWRRRVQDAGILKDLAARDHFRTTREKKAAKARASRKRRRDG